MRFGEGRKTEQTAIECFINNLNIKIMNEYKEKRNFKKMKYFVFILLCVSMFTHAQNRVTGIVKDAKDSSPVPYTTIALLRSDSTVVKGVITGEDGKFAIENVESGDYLLQVSFVGYEKIYRMINVPAQNDLGEIKLVEDSKLLGEVTVTALRPEIIQRPDRYIMNVSNIQSAGRDALGVLAVTPGILVNPNGGITVMGNGVQIWIDGRPSNLSGEELRILLSTMQGNEIDRIEVITNPPSRYDAQGSGGIINIRTTKGLQLGLNGSVSLGYRQGYSDRENTGLSLNYRNPIVNIYGNYGYSRAASWANYELIDEMKTDEGLVKFVSQSKLRNGDVIKGTHQLRIGGDFFINDKNTIGILFNGYSLGKSEEVRNGTTSISPVFQGVSSAVSKATVGGSRDGEQVNLNYQGLFNKPEQQLNVDLNYARFYSEGFQNIQNEYFNSETMLIDMPELLRHNNPRNIRLLSANTDYSQPLWEGGSMELGGKLSQSKTDNNLLYEEYSHPSGIWETDVNQTRSFEYTETVGALYTSITQTVNDKWSLQAGLRGEYTETVADQKTLNVINTSNYFDLFPTFFAMYTPGKGHNFRFSYSRRLRRPDYSFLDPFEVRFDTYTFAVGNPDLKPSYSNNLQLLYSYKQFMTNVGYTYMNGLIVESPIVDNNRHGTMPVNFDKRQNFIWTMNYRPQLTRFWNIFLYSEAAYMINQAEKYENKGFGFYVSLNNRLTITPKLSAEVNGYYVSRMRTGYYVNEPYGGLSLGLRQLFWSDRLTVALSANDILNTSISRSSADTGQIYQWGKENHDNRWVNLSISYKFGSNKVKGSRDRSVGNEDEVGRVN